MKSPAHDIKKKAQRNLLYLDICDIRAYFNTCAEKNAIVFQKYYCDQTVEWVKYSILGTSISTIWCDFLENNVQLTIFHNLEPYFSIDMLQIQIISRKKKSPNKCVYS